MISCTTVNYEPVHMYDEYFPLNTNDTVHFKVTTIEHNSFGKDTLIYWLREVITDDFIDGEGDLAYRLERYWRMDTTQSYDIKDVWMMKKNIRSAEKVEENVRYIKMVFPLSYYVFWDGNALNNIGEQEYTIEFLHEPYLINNMTFDSTVTISHNDKSNLLEYESAYEVYAINVGLVYKEEIILNINSGNVLDVNYGTEYRQELLNY